MANQRKKGIERLTLTLPDELLASLEADASARGVDRLALLREILADYLNTQHPKSTKRGVKRATAQGGL
jgi:metal-responsive CopG/Arc/MetJ family transcriptional regulator